MRPESLLRLRYARRGLVQGGYCYSLGFAASLLLPGEHKTSTVGAWVLLGLAAAAGALWLIDAAVMARADRRIAARRRLQDRNLP